MPFASGQSAWFLCGKCGCRGRYTDSVSDGEYPGMRVHSDCRDMAHPAEKPFKAEDAVILRHPSPDIDDDTPGDTGTSFAAAMGFDTYFGGNT